MDGESVAEQLARMAEADRAAMLDGLDVEALEHDPNFWLRGSQLEALRATEWLILMLAGRGAGKALWNEELIPTPSGWTRICDLSVGDEVFDHAGRPTEVLGVYPQGNVPCYRVVFNDGTSIVASEDHLWTSFMEKNRRWYADEIDVREPDPNWWRWQRAQSETTFVTSYSCKRDSHVREPHERKNTQKQTNTGPTIVTTLGLQGARIPVTNALCLPDANLPVDPYVFGAWLGDGSTGSGHLCAGAGDAEAMMVECNRRGYPASAVKTDTRTGVVTWKMQRLHDELKCLGLTSGRPTKSVPSQFLRGSVSQRLDFVRGLMDTDGSCGRGRVASAGFVNGGIADALEECLRSLGYITRRRARVLKATKTRDERSFFVIDVRPVQRMNPFSLPRKADLVTDLPRDQATRKTMRVVTSVEPLTNLPATCIKVAAESELFLAGRAMVPTHNTRTGSEWVRDQARIPGTRIALVARTVADCRDTLVQGESGIMALSAPSEAPTYVPSLRRLNWPNGSVAITYSAEKPSQLRGPQFHKAWADELATWRLKPDDSGLNAWDNLQIATRLGLSPQIFATTTPKRVPTIRSLVSMARTDSHRVKLIRGSTMDNAANLAAVYLETIMGKYAGTSIERQELYGELLDAVEGALWNDDLIELHRVYDIGALDQAEITVVGVDPSVAEKPGDECGIVVAKSTRERELHKRQAWVVDDRSILGSPEVWAKVAIEAAKDWKAIVVAEKNQGGELVRMVLNGVDPTVPVVLVTATKGKAIRAEPCLLAYEQGRVHHVGRHVELEDELTGWVPGESGWSPNRLDACLVSGTPVHTRDGVVPIETVIPGQQVWTRRGWRHVEAARQTQEAAVVGSITMSNGQTLVGTPDHLVLTSRGFLRMDSLVCGDTLSGWQDLSSTVGSTTHDQTGTTSTEDDQVHCSTATCGSTTTGRSSETCWSITTTKIRPTTRSRTFDSSHGKNTLRSILNHTRYSSHGWTTHGSLRLSGIGLKKVVHGIARRLFASGLTQLLASNLSVRSAVQPSLAIVIGSSALGPAPDERRTVTTHMRTKSRAQTAESSSGRTSIATHLQPVHVSVVQPYEELGERRDVYDLQVAGEHEFLAAGVIVHNCVWALTALLVDPKVLRSVMTDLRASRIPLEGHIQDAVPRYRTDTVRAAGSMSRGRGSPRGR